MRSAESHSSFSSDTLPRATFPNFVVGGSSKKFGDAETPPPWNADVADALDICCLPVVHLGLTVFLSFCLAL